jgi:uncharacterized membrane protein
MGAAAAVVLLGASSPPFLSSAWRSLMMDVFAPLCHQLPARSPVVDGTQLAVCDRCFGIYGGVLVGVATAGWARGLWGRLRTVDHLVLLGSLLPLAVDWLGPVLGLWANAPLSRAVTGGLFGGVAASFTATQILAGLGTRSS